MEKNMQMLDDAELPLEENFYEHGENICKAVEPSFMTINFYNVAKSDQEFILGILKQFNYIVNTAFKVSDNVKMVSINL